MPVRKKRKKSAPSDAPATPVKTSSKAGIQRSTYTTMVGVGVALIAVGWLIFGGGPEDATIVVNVPELTANAAKGKETFNRTCVECHGENAAGSKTGPPLIDSFYRPSHHDNGSFLSAIRRGVRQHHWKFGPMPPQPGVKSEEIPDLITYIREIQKANGII